MDESSRHRDRFPHRGGAQSRDLVGLRRTGSRGSLHGHSTSAGLRTAGSSALARAHAVRRVPQPRILIMGTLFRGRDASVAGPRALRSMRYALVVLPLAVVTFACDDLTNLEQENPSQILANDAYIPRNATLLVNGAIGDFECALFRYTAAAALLGDELVNAFANTANDNYDRRSHPLTGAYAGGCGAHQQPGVYTSLSVARASADTVVARLEEWT